MISDQTDDAPLKELIRDLDKALELGGLRWEVDRRMSFVHPLELAVAKLTDPGDIPGGTPATRIAMLLWLKTHPEHLDPDSLLPDLQDSDPLVRITAMDALLPTLTQERWSEPRLLRRVRTLLQAQRRVEPLPVVAYQIDRLLGEMRSISGRQPAESRLLNPYLAGPVIDVRDRFFGREDTLREIRAALSVDSGIKSVIVYGARRTGKTSLLYRFKEDVLENDAVVYVDMQSLAGQSLPHFLGTLVASIETAIEARDALVAIRDELPHDEVDLVSFRRYVDAALDRLAPSSLVILLDEYEVLLDFIRNIDLARQLQSLLEHQRRFSRQLQS